MFVPVVDQHNTPLMPTKPSRARRWIRQRKATPFWKKGVFCIRLNIEPSNRNTQPIVVGIDPGSKKEGLTVKSKARTFLNVQADAVTWVKEAVKSRRQMRRGRRVRKTPYRQPRANRLCNISKLPPSTKARWLWKLRLCCWLVKLFPITTFVVEDIKAKTKGQKRWDGSFSPLEVGKQWFYQQLQQLASVITRAGWETKQMRDTLGLKKTKRKMAELFEAHCVDSWVLAYSQVEGSPQPDNTRLICVTPLRFHRRQLHRLEPGKRGIRRPYGGTRSLEFKRGSLVKHYKYGLVYIGGTLNGKLSLHSLVDGKRLTQNAKPSDCKFIAFNSWRARLLPIH